MALLSQQCLFRADGQCDPSDYVDLTAFEESDSASDRRDRHVRPSIGDGLRAEADEFYRMCDRRLRTFLEERPFLTVDL